MRAPIAGPSLALAPAPSAIRSWELSSEGGFPQVPVFTLTLFDLWFALQVDLFFFPCPRP